MLINSNPRKYQNQISNRKKIIILLFDDVQNNIRCFIVQNNVKLKLKNLLEKEILKLVKIEKVKFNFLNS